MSDKNSSTAITSGMLAKLNANRSNVVLYISISIFLALFIAAFVQIQSFIGSKDDWNTLKPQLIKINLLVSFGIFAFTIASLIYFTQDPQKAVYFTIIVSCISLGLSFMALSVAAISR